MRPRNTIPPRKCPPTCYRDRQGCRRAVWAHMKIEDDEVVREGFIGCREGEKCPESR